MKRKSREVSVFSMSALDLFASALGAFILIAIVILPHFPNTGMADQADLDSALAELGKEAETNARLRKILDDIERVVGDLRRDLAEAERDAARARRDAEDARRDAEDAKAALAEAEFPHLDLVVALDVTGSMRAQIDGLKREVNALTEVLTELMPSVAVGVVAFGDRNWQRSLTVFELTDLSGATANRGRLAQFVETLEPNMGLGSGSNPDDPEAFLTALREAARARWRAQAETKQIVVITDNPAYPEEVETAVAEAASFATGGQGRVVSTVFVNTGSGNEEFTAAFLERIANQGGGQAVQSGGSMTANLLRSLL